MYQTQGRYADAESLLKRALAILEKMFGPDHVDVGRSLNNLAGLYMSQDRYADAEPIYKRALAIIEKALGTDHPDVGRRQWRSWRSRRPWRQRATLAADPAASDTAFALFEAASRNISDRVREEQLRKAIGSLDRLGPPLNAYAAERAEVLADDHTRVRQAPFGTWGNGIQHPRTDFQK